MSLKGIIPSSLHIENGFTYQNVTIPLENQGLVFLRGHNKDTQNERSNGSGKSSFADVLEHVLFESTSRGLDKDEIIRTGSSEGYYAKLCLKTSDGVHYIEQSRKHRKHGTSLRISKEFPHGVEEISPPKNINKTKNQLQTQILKITKQQFHGAVYLSQEAGYPLVTGTGAEVSKYLSDTFGFDVYDTSRAKIKLIIDELQQKLGQAESYIQTIKDIDSKLEEYPEMDYIVTMEKAIKEYLLFGKEQLSSLYDQKSSLISSRSLIERRERLISQLKTNLAPDEVINSIKKKHKLVKSLVSQSNELLQQKTLHTSIKKDASSLKEKEESLINLLTKYSDVSVENVASILETKRSAYNDMRVVLHRSRDVLKSLIIYKNHDSTQEPVHKKALEDYNKNCDLLLSLASQYDALKAALDEATCPTCGQDMPAKVSKDHIQEELSKSISAKKAYKTLLRQKEAADSFFSQHEQYSIVLSSAKSVSQELFSLGLVDSCKEQVLDLCDQFSSGIDTDKINLYKDQITSLSQISDAASEINALRASLNDKILSSESFDLSEIESNIDLINKKIESLRSEISSLEKDSVIYSELSELPEVDASNIENNIQSVESDISNLTSALNDVQEMLTRFSTDAAIIRDLVARKIKASSYLEGFKDDLQQLNWLKTLYKSLAKLKARKLHSVVKSIRDTLPSYTDVMFDGEDISFEINDDDPESVLLWASRPHPEKKGERSWIPVRGLSKGERAGLRVSLLWTLKDITQPEKSVDLLILDEADDGLDETGLAAFASLLEHIRHQYGTVIVISQRKEITGVQFDKIWTAVKQNGITTMEIS